jgi:hypothetical protein
MLMNLKLRNQGMSSTISHMHSGSMTAQLKPKLIESRLGEHEDFMGLSNGFKHVFMNDKVDRKLVIPVLGYGGHRRGDRSHNFFGKSFRDTTIQSKQLERGFRSKSIAI